MKEFYPSLSEVGPRGRGRSSGGQERSGGWACEGVNQIKQGAREPQDAESWRSGGTHSDCTGRNPPGKVPPAWEQVTLDPWILVQTSIVYVEDQEGQVCLDTCIYAGN